MLASCAVNEPGVGGGNGLRGVIAGGGSSAQQAAQNAWIVGFQTDNTGATIEYDSAGSGAGREMFIAGGTTFAGSDRAFTVEELRDEEFKACEPGSSIIEIPAYISPIAVVFNLKDIDNLNLDADTIARIFSGDITRWDDEAIAGHNPGVELPDTRITAVHRSDDSGVTENFTEYLSAAASKAWPHDPSGEWPIDGGEAAQGTSGVVDTVRTGRGMIGYIDASRAGELGLVSVRSGNEYVPYSSKAAAAIVDASPVATGRAPGDLAIELDRTSSASGVYPIVLVSYLIGCADYVDDDDAVLVRGYFEHVISVKGQRDAAKLAGSAPISSGLAERAAAAVMKIK